MSLLEERILRIIELREKGLEDKDIAKELGLEEKTIKLYEDSTKKAINYLVSAGYEQEEIAKNIGLSLTAFNLFTTYYNIKILSQKRRRSIAQSIVKIREAVNNGNSIEKISEKTGLAVSTIVVYAQKEKIKLPEGSYGYYKPNEKRTVEIKQAIAEGAKSVQEVSKRTGLAPSTLRVYATQLRIKLPYSEVVVYYKQKFKTKRDRLIRRGLGLGDICRKEKVTREAIRRYILTTGLYEKWKESRKDYKKRKKPEQLKKEALRKIVASIDLIARQKLKEDEKLAYEKATEYFSLTRKSTYSFNTLFSFFKKYDDAKKAGKKLSLEELGKDFNIGPREAGGILKKGREGPLYGSRIMKKIPKDKKEVLDRAIKIKMPYADIAYFLGINSWVIQAYHRKNFDIGRPKFKPLMKIIGKGLTYRLASEIYEARDLGFSKKETIELLDITKKIVDYAQEHRKTIEHEIIDALRILYPKKRITKPYTNFK